MTGIDTIVRYCLIFSSVSKIWVAEFEFEVRITIFKMAEKIWRPKNEKK